MPLVDQQVPILFAGLNQGQDPKTAPIGTLDLVENSYREKQGEYRKRAGTSNLTAPGGTTTARALYSLGSQLTVSASGTLYGRANSAWNSKGSGRAVAVSMAGVAAGGTSPTPPAANHTNDRNQDNPDVAYNAGLLCYVWEERTQNYATGNAAEYGVIFYSVADSTGNVVVPRTSLTTSYRDYLPKVVAVGTDFVIFWQNTPSPCSPGGTVTGTGDVVLKNLTVPVSAPGTPTAAVSVRTMKTIAATAVARPYAYDVAVNGSTILVCYKSGTAAGDNLFVFGCNAAGTITIAAVDQGIDANSFAISWLHHTFGDGFGYIANGAEPVKVNATTAAYVSGSADATTLEQCTGYFTGGSTFIIYSVSPTTKYNTVTYTRTNVAAATALKRSVTLASRVYKLGSDYLVNVVYDHRDSGVSYQSEQTRLFVLDAQTGEIIAVPLPPGLSPPPPTREGSVPSGAVVSATHTVAAISRVVGTDAVGATAAAETVKVPQTFALSLKVDESLLSQPAFAADGAVIPGGVTRFYDGATVSELGYHVFPEKPAATNTSTPALGSIANGAYNYIVLYEWTDRNGRIHRSKQSTTSGTVTVAAANRCIEIACPTLRLTEKQGLRIAIFREDDADGEYRRVASIQNDTTADTVTRRDAMPKADRLLGELLDTSGTAVDIIGPPSTTCVAAAKERVWFGGLCTSEVWYSLPVIDGFGIDTSDFLADPIGATDGTETALAVLDEKAIIFKGNAIYLASGDGPNAIGAGAWFFQEIARGVGTSKPKSVATIPGGVVFQSADGWQMLNRSLQVDPAIGVGVKDYETLTVTGSAVLPARSHLMYFTSDGRSLVWDWAFGQWYTYTTQAAVAGCVFGTGYAYAKSDGTVCYEVAGQYADNAATYAQKWRTTWLSFAGVLGFQRVYALQVLGEYVGAHTLRFTWEVDNDSSSSTAYNVTPTANPYQFECRPARQQCTMARLTLEEVPGSNAGFQLSAISALVGAERGRRPLATTARAT